MKKSYLKKNNIHKYKINIKKIVSIALIFLLISTIATSIVNAELLKYEKKPLKEILQSLKEKTEKLTENISILKTKENTDIDDKIDIETSENPMTKTLTSYSSFKAAAESSLTFYTNYNGIKKTSELGLFRSVSVDVDDDGDNDINARINLYPGVETPFSLSINFGLTIKQLNGFDDTNAFFEVYAEFTRPGLISQNQTGDKIYFGYQSPTGQRIPDSCTVTYKFIPYILRREKPVHKLHIDPGEETVGNMGLIIGYIDINNSLVVSENKFKILYEPAVESEITFGRLGGAKVEFERIRTNDSLVSIYIAHTEKENTTCAYVKNIPSHVTIAMDIGKNGLIEFNTHGEQADEIGVCDDFYNPVNKIYLTNLFTLARLEWNRDLLGSGKANVSVYSDGTGVDLNAHLVGSNGSIIDFTATSSVYLDFSAELDISGGYMRLIRSDSNLSVSLYVLGFNGSTLDWSFNIERVQDGPFEIFFNKLINEKIDFSFAGKSITISGFYLMLNLANISIGVKAETIVFDQDGSINVIILIKKQGENYTFNVTLDVIRGIYIYGLQLSYNGIWTPPYDIIIDGSVTRQFEITVEDFDMEYKIGDDSGYILIWGSISLTNYRTFTYNGIEGGVTGTISTGSKKSDGLNISWYKDSENGSDVFKLNITGFMVELKDFHLFFGDYLDLSIPNLTGSIQLKEACKKSGEFLFELQGGGSSLDVDIYQNFNQDSNFELKINLDDFHIDLPDTSAMFSFVWADGNVSSIGFDAITDINLEIFDLDIEFYMNGSNVLFLDSLYANIDGHAGFIVDINLPLNQLTSNETLYLNLTEDIFGFKLKDVYIYLHIADISLLDGYLDLDEIELEVDVIGEANISFVKFYAFYDPFWSSPSEDSYFYWIHITLGIDAGNGNLNIKILKIGNFSEIIKLLGFTLWFPLLFIMDDFSINGYTDFTVIIGGWSGAPQDLKIAMGMLGMRFDNDAGTNITMDKLTVSAVISQFWPESPLTKDTTFVGYLENMILKEGSLNVIITILNFFALEISDGSAIEFIELGAEMPGYFNVALVIDEPFDYLNIDGGIHYVDPPYDIYVLLDTKNTTVDIDFFVILTPEFINLGIDLINNQLGLSIPYPNLINDLGIRFNNVKFKADELYIYLNLSADQVIDGYLHIEGYGKIWYLVNGYWEPLFGDIGFSLTVNNNHIKIQFLAESSIEIVDYYNSNLGLYLSGVFYLDVGMAVDVDIYWAELSGDVEITANGDIQIEEFVFALGDDFRVSIDEFLLDVDGSAGIFIDLNNLDEFTLTLDADLDRLMIENFEVYAYIQGFELNALLGGDFDLSAASDVEINVKDLNLSSLSFDISLSGSFSGNLNVNDFYLNVNNDDLVVSCDLLFIRGSGSLSLEDGGISLSASLSFVQISNLYAYASGKSITLTGTLDLNGVGLVNIYTNTGFNGLSIDAQGSGTLTLTNLYLGINDGTSFLIVSCNSIFIKAGVTAVGSITISGNGVSLNKISFSSSLTSVYINNLHVHAHGAEGISISGSFDLSASAGFDVISDLASYLELSVNGGGKLTANNLHISVKNILSIDASSIELSLGAYASLKIVDKKITFGGSGSVSLKIIGAEVYLNMDNSRVTASIPSLSLSLGAGVDKIEVDLSGIPDDGNGGGGGDDDETEKIVTLRAHMIIEGSLSIYGYLTLQDAFKIEADVNGNAKIEILDFYYSVSEEGSLKYLDVGYAKLEGYLGPNGYFSLGDKIQVSGSGSSKINLHVENIEIHNPTRTLSIQYLNGDFKNNFNLGEYLEINIDGGFVLNNLVKTDAYQNIDCSISSISITGDGYFYLGNYISISGGISLNIHNYNKPDVISVENIDIALSGSSYSRIHFEKGSYLRIEGEGSTVNIPSLSVTNIRGPQNNAVSFGGSLTFSSSDGVFEILKESENSIRISYSGTTTLSLNNLYFKYNDLQLDVDQIIIKKKTGSGSISCSLISHDDGSFDISGSCDLHLEKVTLSNKIKQLDLDMEGSITFNLDKTNEILSLSATVSYDFNLEMYGWVIEKVKSTSGSFDGSLEVDFSSTIVLDINSWSHITNIEIWYTLTEKTILTEMNLQNSIVTINISDNSIGFEGRVTIGSYIYRDNLGIDRITITNLDVDGDIFVKKLGEQEFYIESQSGFHFYASVSTIKILELEFTLDFYIKGDITVKWWEENGDQHFQFDSNQGFEGDLTISINDYIFEIDLGGVSPGYAGFAWNLDEDLDGMVFMDSSDLTITGSIIAIHNDHGICVSIPSFIDADGFLVQWDPPILNPLNWHTSGSIDGNVDIDVTRNSGATWYDIYPLGNYDVGYIAGQVMKLGTNQPIAGATVSTDDDSDITDENGDYQLIVIAGSHSVTASAEGYRSEVKEVNVPSGQTRNVDFSLMENGNGYIEGYVLDIDTFDGIYGALVSTSTGSSTTTNPNGYYNLMVNSGDHILTASAAGYDSSSKEVYVADGATITEYFLLIPISTGNIHGYVKDATTNNGIGGANVVVTPGGYSTTTMSIGAQIGLYSFDLPPGTYDITASKNGYYSNTLENINIEGGDYIYLPDISLVPQGNPDVGYILGHVYDDTGSPLYGVTVSTVNTMPLTIQGNVGATDTTDSQGYYILEVNAGLHYVTASKSGYQTETAYVTVNAGQTKTQNFILTPQGGSEGYIHGHVYNDAGQPISGAYVHCTGASDTTDNQGYYLLTVAAGNNNGYGFFVTAEEDGHQTKTKYVSWVGGGEYVTLDFYLTPFVPFWSVPHSYEDPYDEWNDEFDAIDGKSNTAAYSNQADSNSWEWTGFLILTFNVPTNSDRLKFYSWRYDANRCNRIDIDVYWSGSWHDVYEGSYAEQWETKYLPGGQHSISKARVRFQIRKYGIINTQADLNEIQFWITTG